MTEQRAQERAATRGSGGGRVQRIASFITARVCCSMKNRGPIIHYIPIPPYSGPPSSDFGCGEESHGSSPWSAGADRFKSSESVLREPTVAFAKLNANAMLNATW